MSAIPSLNPRWRRFSLRAMLAVMTLCCAAMGVWTIVVAPYRDQHFAAQAVIDAKGTFQTEAPDDSAWRRWLVCALLGDDRYINVVAVTLNDATLDESLLRRLGDLREVRELNLDRSTMTDPRWSVLAKLQQLQSLSLRSTSIDDVGLKVVAGNPRLETLQLSGAPITTASAEIFAQLPNLRQLYIRGTQLSPAEARDLAAKLPDCRIYYEGAKSGP